MEKNKAIPFTKMTGAGNDFVLFDNRTKILTEDYSLLAQKVCDRKFSVGADGLLIVEKSSQADFRMVYYNSDGSRAEMCGNGARCIARFAHMLKIAPAKTEFITDAGILSAEVKGESVKLKMSEPKNLKLDFSIKLDNGNEMSLSSVNTGVPHAVLMVTDIDKIDAFELGKNIRYHKEFAPAGTNANFVLVKDEQTLAVRTYERGVENETLACGTGTVASSLVCAAKGLVKSPVACTTKGGGTLRVYFKMIEESKAQALKNLKISFSEVYLEGPATICFTGNIVI